MEIIPDKQKVIGLVDRAYTGRICLPNFQRDFVWSREAVADLVRSIVRGYFIGSLLLLDCDPGRPPFAPVFLRGSKSPLAHPKPEQLVLDGQQRLSALIYALTAPDLSLKDSIQRRWFFLDLDALLDDPDRDDIVVDRSMRDLGGLDVAAHQYAQRKLPCTRLRSQDSFYEWRDGYEDWLEATSSDDLRMYRAQLRNRWTTIATAFQSFEVPLVLLPRFEESDQEAIGRVCAIFEKLNSTGVELSVYDLLTARLYRSNVKLHDLWTQACKDNPRLNSWSQGRADKNSFGVLILRTLALLRGLDPKARVLINLSSDGFAADWRRAARAIERALQLLTNVGDDGFGVFKEKFFPGFGLLPILAALRAKIDDLKLGEGPRSDVRRWYWSNVFLERYSSGVESKSRKDYLEMTRYWLEGGPSPDVFGEAQAYIGSAGFRIRSSASYASAVYNGVFSLLALQGAQDWRRSEDILLQDLQDHHIFPRNYLNIHKIAKPVDVNTIVNRTLISDETNGRIKDAAPAAYILNQEVFPKGPLPELLDPHFIDAPALAAMAEAKRELRDTEVAAVYEQFLRAREAAIVDKIRQVCGVSPLAETAFGEEVVDVAADVAAGVSSIESDEAA
jgi:hypothetical protein